ncbi:Tn3 family transposase [Serratia ureilytica]|nr:Tn3 family transposase [Serratia ureilytica]MBF8441869.1 Tn3 family transposase [Serratia ureilytica]MBF8446814.1 Tn3 family transposase [Serratia ureilytica]
MIVRPYLLNYIDDEDYRRRILTQLNVGEGRHAVARAICYGMRGEISKGVSLDIENYCTLRLFFDLSNLAGLSRRNLPETGIRLFFQI